MRALLPSWRFFDTIATPLALWICVDDSWRELPLVPARRWYALFCNPEGNVGLLVYSTMERLLSELDDGPPEQQVSYTLLRNFAGVGLAAGTLFQFELRDADTQQVLLRSLPHTKGPAR